MLLGGINHVAVLTSDTERFLEFYVAVFGVTYEVLQAHEDFNLTLVWVGPTTELNVFELDGNAEHMRQVPMFGRWRLDHLALEAASIDAFDEVRARLLVRGATDGFVTDVGHILKSCRGSCALPSACVYLDPLEIGGWWRLGTVTLSVDGRCECRWRRSWACRAGRWPV